MLNVFICEDESEHQNQIREHVEKCITIYNLNMRISLATDNPNEVIKYLERNNVSGLYFLDIDLNHELDGVQLALAIREHDPRGFIVFVTTHEEAIPLTFHHKIEALDFIIKEDFGDLQERVYSCTLNAHTKYSAANTAEQQKTFSFYIFDKLISIEYSNILYFETSSAPHKIKLHTINGIYEFYGSLSELEQKLGKSFYRCHQSTIINVTHILELNKLKKIVKLSKDVICMVASRRLQRLVELLEDNPIR